MGSIKGCLVLFIFLAGCAAPSHPPPTNGVPAALSCLAPCEVGIDTGPGHAFEPSAASDPTNPLHIVVGASEMTTDPAGVTSRWNKAYVSMDGGVTWKTARLPGGPGSDPQGPLGTATEMADPEILILADGTVLYAGIAGQAADSDATGAFLVSGLSLYVARSTDGGLSYPDVAIVAQGKGAIAGVYTPATGDQGAGYFDDSDKPGIAMGPDGTLIAVWSHIQSPPTDELGRLNRNDVVYSVSKDGGKTWSPPGLVAKGGGGREIDGGAPAIGHDGVYYVASWDFSKNEAILATSKDQGATWALQSLGPTHAFPTIRVHALPGGKDRITIAYSIGGGSKPETPALVTSDDGGTTWTKPLLLDSPEAPGYIAPAMDLDAQGRAWVGFFHPKGDGSQNDYRVAMVDNGSVVGPIVVSSSSIGAETRGLTLGHYMGLASLPDGALPVWVSGTSPATDLRSARVFLS